MNCKKIFALLLSLCMVLSSFVAVSAAEQIYNVGTQYDVIASSGNSDTDGIGYGNHQNVTFSEATVEGRTNVHKVVASGATGASSFYMPLKDVNGNQITQATFPKSGTLTWSVDIMVSDVTGINTSVALRSSGQPNATPLNGGELSIKTNLGLESGVWKTVNGTVDLKTCAFSAAGYATVMVRLNIPAGAEMYVDNFTWSINDKDYYGNVYAGVSASDIIVGKDKDSGDALTHAIAKSPTDGTTDVVKVSGTVNGYGRVIGAPLKDANGAYVKELAVGDKVRYDIKLYTTVGFSLPAPGDRAGLVFRRGTWNDGEVGPSASSQWQFAQEQTIPANQWVTVKGSYAIDDAMMAKVNSGGLTQNINACIRASWATAGDIYFEKFDITVEKPVTQVVEAGWAAPDYSIPHTLARGAAVSAVTNGTFTATLKQIADFTRAAYPDEPNRWGENCGFQEWVKIIPEEEIPAGRDLKITYDLTTEGILDKNGAPVSNITVRGRFFKAANRTEVSSAYRPYQSVAANTGEPVRVVMDIPGDSYAEALNYIGIAVSLTDNVKTNDYADSDAYFTISNITIEYTEPTLSFSADDESLVVENTSKSKYRFSGRLLAAEYDMTDDVPELLQFKEIDLSDVEVAAGGEETIAINFAKAVKGTVKLFLWEPGSFTPFVTVE